MPEHLRMSISFVSQSCTVHESQHVIFLVKRVYPEPLQGKLWGLKICIDGNKLERSLFYLVFVSHSYHSSFLFSMNFQIWYIFLAHLVYHEIAKFINLMTIFYLCYVVWYNITTYTPYHDVMVYITFKLQWNKYTVFIIAVQAVWVGFISGSWCMFTLCFLKVILDGST